jgi:hypothetical protein
MKLIKNVGFVDQILRALLILDFLIFCGLDLVSDMVAGFLLVISMLLAVSCITGYCPLYKSLNISTRQEVNA